MGSYHPFFWTIRKTPSKNVAQYLVLSGESNHQRPFVYKKVLRIASEWFFFTLLQPVLLHLKVIKWQWFIFYKLGTFQSLKTNWSDVDWSSTKKLLWTLRFFRLFRLCVHMPNYIFASLKRQKLSIVLPLNRVWVCRVKRIVESLECKSSQVKYRTTVEKIKFNPIFWKKRKRNTQFCFAKNSERSRFKERK